MKNLFLLLVMAGLVVANCGYAKQPNLQKDKAVDNNTNFDNAVRAIMRNDFILKADILNMQKDRPASKITGTSLRYSYNSINNNVNPDECFLIVEGDKGQFQVHPAGYVFAGDISGTEFKQDKKGNIKYSFRLTGDGNSAKVYLTLKKGSNAATATARLERMTIKNDLTFIGKIYPTAGQVAIKGFVKQSRGTEMNPFVNP